ncbi:hypothetical protein TNCV_4356861 [Trichonephila clavipes]|nr:hypothetical protein TNCV_4356861 [Trichonephila clavipes]
MYPGEDICLYSNQRERVHRITGYIVLELNKEDQFVGIRHAFGCVNEPVVADGLEPRKFCTVKSLHIFYSVADIDEMGYQETCSNIVPTHARTLYTSDT